MSNRRFFQAVYQLTAKEKKYQKKKKKTRKKAVEAFSAGRADREGIENCELRLDIITAATQGSQLLPKMLQKFLKALRLLPKQMPYTARLESGFLGRIPIITREFSLRFFVNLFV